MLDDGYTMGVDGGYVLHLERCLCWKGSRGR